MLQIDPFLFFLLVEGFGITTLVLIVWGFLALRRRGRERRAVEKLIAAVNEADGPRREETEGLLATAGLGGEALSNAVGGIVREERMLYKAIISAFLKRDAEALVAMSTLVPQATGTLRGLLADAGRASAPPAADPEHETLRAENTKLTDELRITKQTMSNMLSEYAQMYARGDGSVVESNTASRLLAAEAAEAAEGLRSNEATGEPVGTSTMQTDAVPEDAPPGTGVSASAHADERRAPESLDSLLDDDLDFDGPEDVLLEEPGGPDGLDGLEGLDGIETNLDLPAPEASDSEEPRSGGSQAA